MRIEATIPQYTINSVCIEAHIYCDPLSNNHLNIIMFISNTYRMINMMMIEYLYSFIPTWISSIMMEMRNEMFIDKCTIIIIRVKIHR